MEEERKVKLYLELVCMTGKTTIPLRQREWVRGKAWLESRG